MNVMKVGSYRRRLISLHKLIYSVFGLCLVKDKDKGLDQWDLKIIGEVVGTIVRDMVKAILRFCLFLFEDDIGLRIFYRNV